MLKEALWNLEDKISIISSRMMENIRKFSREDLGNQRVENLWEKKLGREMTTYKR